LLQATKGQLSGLVERIVQVVHPLRIIVFGSAARGDATPGSDVDILVVMPEGTPRRATARYLHTQLFGIPFAVDLIVTTPSHLEKHRDNLGLIYRTILAEGKELYAA
jgi:predicted nucleotidyltransferase